ncbi:MAG: hypothetical protein H6807_04665 [Planctomycetes bacterium]|nr:hypothetical protein [Planctomycetota bacterium]
MKRFAALLAVALLATSGLFAQETPTAEVVKFQAKAPGVGDVVNRASTQGVDLQIDMSMGEMGSQAITQKMDFSDSRACTVLETKDGAVTKFKVAYQKLKATMKMESPMQPEPIEMDMFEGTNPSGNTYLFTVVDGALKITSMEGEEVSGDLVTILTAMEWTDGRLGCWAPLFSEFTDKREMTIGETINVPREKALSFIPQQNRDQLGDAADVVMTLTLKETTTTLGAKVAVFDAKMKITASPAAEEGLDMTLNVEMEGSMSVGLDNMWVYSSKMKGPLKMSGGSAEMGMQMNGSGTLRSDALSVYSKAKAEETK